MVAEAAAVPLRKEMLRTRDGSLAADAHGEDALRPTKGHPRPTKGHPQPVDEAEGAEEIRPHRPPTVTVTGRLFASTHFLHLRQAPHQAPHHAQHLRQALHHAPHHAPHRDRILLRDQDEKESPNHDEKKNRHPTISYKTRHAESLSPLTAKTSLPLPACTSVTNTT